MHYTADTSEYTCRYSCPWFRERTCVSSQAAVRSRRSYQSYGNMHNPVDLAIKTSALGAGIVALLVFAVFQLA